MRAIVERHKQNSRAWTYDDGLMICGPMAEPDASDSIGRQDCSECAIQEICGAYNDWDHFLTIDITERDSVDRGTIAKLLWQLWHDQASEEETLVRIIEACSD